MKYLDAAQKYFLAFCMLFTTGLLFVNVILRYFFHSAIFWAEEVLRYCIVWVAFIGASTCVKEESHISIDILSSALKPRGKKILTLFLQLAGTTFSGFFLVISLRFIMQIRSSNQLSATIGNVPMYLIYLCFPIGFSLYMIRSVEVFVRTWKSLWEEGKDI